MRILISIFLSFSVCGFAELSWDELQNIDRTIEKENIQTLGDARRFIVDLICQLKQDGLLNDDFKSSDLQEIMIQEIRDSVEEGPSRDRMEKEIHVMFDEINSLKLLRIGAYNPQFVNDQVGEDLPPRLICGIVELGAGLLLCIAPPLRTVGMLVAMDGFKRILDGTEEAENIQRKMAAPELKMLGTSVLYKQQKTSCSQQPYRAASDRIFMSLR